MLIVHSRITDLVDACYAPVTDERAWAQGVADATERAFSGLAGVVSTLVDLKADGTVVPRLLAGHRGLCETAAAMFPLLDEADTRRLFLERPVTNMEQVIARSAAPELRTAWKSAGWGGSRMLGISGVDPGGHGFGLALVTHASPTASIRRTLTRLAGHLATARRYWSRKDASPSAWVAPDGKILEAEGSAVPDREALRSQALAVERARRMDQNDPEAALALWTALVDGRWTLVERFEADGRRIYVARRNDPETALVSALSEVERKVIALLRLNHSAKLIAYELGYSESTVSRAARSALRKLGLRSRAELISVHGALGGRNRTE